MIHDGFKFFFIIIFTTTNIKYTLSIREGNPKLEFEEIHDPAPLITIDKIQTTLRDCGIFDEKTANLTQQEKQQLNDLWEYITIVMTSRNRQPSFVQNQFNTLETVKSIVEEQLAGKLISKSLAAKFKWEFMRMQRETDERKPGIHIKENLV